MHSFFALVDDVGTHRQRHVATDTNEVHCLVLANDRVHSGVSGLAVIFQPLRHLHTCAFHVGVVGVNGRTNKGGTTLETRAPCIGVKHTDWLFHIRNKGYRILHGVQVVSDYDSFKVKSRVSCKYSWPCSDVRRMPLRFWSLRDFQCSEEGVRLHSRTGSQPQISRVQQTASTSNSTGRTTTLHLQQ